MTGISRLKMWLLVSAIGMLAAGLARAEERAYETVGRKFTAIPLLNFSSDDGAGYGLRASVFDYDGVSVPYRSSYSVQAFFTTKGKWAHRLYLDIPNVRPGHRIEMEALYEKEDYANYYGGLASDALDGYTREQKTFKQDYPKLRVMWIVDLRLPWRVRAGLQVGRNRVTPNAGAGNILSDANPPGAGGGTHVQASAGLQYDSRDDYNNSTEGIFEELLVEYGLGSGFKGGKISYEHRHFLPIQESWILAHRLNVGVTFGDVPFYESFDLGGSNTLRGSPAASWRGEGRLLFNAELRWRGLRLSQTRNIYLGLLAFGDAGQIFSREDGPSLDDWKVGGGAGLRFHWHSTIVRADYGISEDKTGIYITFSQVF